MYTIRVNAFIKHMNRMFVYTYIIVCLLMRIAAYAKLAMLI